MASSGSPVGHAILGGEISSSVSGAAVFDDEVVLVGNGTQSGPGRTWPTVWLSTDGGDWQRREPGALGLVGADFAEAGVLMRDVAVDDTGRLVAVGYANHEPESEPLAWRSTDEGETWHLMTVPSESPFASVESVTWWRDRYVAVGEDDGRPAAWVSTDGDSWTHLGTASLEGGFGVVVAHRDRVVVAAHSNDGTSQLWYADDDLVWHPAGSPVDGVIDDIGSDGQQLVAVGSAQAAGGDTDIVVLTSTTGDIWQVHPGSVATAPRAEKRAFAVRVHDGGFLVGGRADGRAALWEGSVDETMGPGRLRRVAASVFDLDAAVTGFAATSEQILGFGYRESPSGEQAVLWSRGGSFTELDLPGWFDLGPLRPARFDPVTADTKAGLLLWGGEPDSSRHGPATWSGLLVDPATGWSRVIGTPDICGAQESRAAWTGQELIVWAARAKPSDSCPAAARLDPATGMWTGIDSDFFPRVGDAPVVSTGSELLAWTEGLAFDLQEETTHEFPPIPDVEPDAVQRRFSPATAHWTGDRIVVLGDEAPVVYEPATQSWSTGPLPPIGGSGRASAWTGTQLLAVNYEMEAATFDPVTAAWSPQDPVPLRFFECQPHLAAASSVTVAGLCSGHALWDGSGQWKLLSRPRPGGRLATTANHLFEVGSRLLQTALPEPDRDGVQHPRHFPVGVLQLSLPDGWNVAEHPHSENLRPRTAIDIPLRGPGGARCSVSADHSMDAVAPEGDPADLAWERQGQPLDVREDIKDNLGHVTVTSPEMSTDLTEVVCDDLADARIIASHLWLPSPE